MKISKHEFAPSSCQVLMVPSGFAGAWVVLLHSGTAHGAPPFTVNALFADVGGYQALILDDNDHPIEGSPDLEGGLSRKRRMHDGGCAQLCHYTGEGALGQLDWVNYSGLTTVGQSIRSVIGNGK